MQRRRRRWRRRRTLPPGADPWQRVRPDALAGGKRNGRCGTGLHKVLRMPWSSTDTRRWRGLGRILGQTDVDSFEDRHSPFRPERRRLISFSYSSPMRGAWSQAVVLCRDRWIDRRRADRTTNLRRRPHGPWCRCCCRRVHCRCRCCNCWNHLGLERLAAARSDRTTSEGCYREFFFQ